jgi:hypothetical protein
LQLLSLIVEHYNVIKNYTMKHTLFKIFLLLLVIGIIAACSKLADNIPPAPEINTHNPGISDTSSGGFHRNLVSNAPNGMFDCQQCHAVDWSGGITGVGCNTTDCHPSINIHVEGITDTISDDFHGNFIRRNGWDILDCKKCHGNDYGGGVNSPSCLNCHTQPGGPESCNTCHGNFNDPAFIAPPQDTKNNTSTDFSGVGAHGVHLFENDLGNQIECSTCHVVPQNYSDPGHVDTPPPAEVLFGNIAITNVAVNADYDHSSATCSDTFCHGNFEYLKDAAPENHKFAFEEGADRMTGNNRLVVWNNVDGSQALCGSCHNLPPVGHVEADITACGTCHSGIFDRDGNLVDSLSYKHINGEIDLFF